MTSVLAEVEKNTKNVALGRNKYENHNIADGIIKGTDGKNG